MKLKKLTAVLMIFFIVTAITSLASAENSTVKASDAAAARMELHGFYPAYISYSSALEKYMDSMDSISFAWGRLYHDRLEAVNAVKGQNNNTMFYYPGDFEKPLKYAKAKGKPVQISIFTDAYNAERILPYKDKRDLAVRSIMDLLDKSVVTGEKLYFDGVVIDFEGLRNKDSEGKDLLYNGLPISTYFNTFLAELNTQLDKTSKKLYVAVNPRIYYDGFDYKQILKVADKMIIMAHDYEPASVLSKSEVTQYTGCNALEPIDSLAPAKKIRLALEDVKNSIASSEDWKKVWLQLSFDSSQWRFEASGREGFEALPDDTKSKEERLTPTYEMIKNRVDNKDNRGSSIAYSYNNELQSPSIQYYNSFDKTYNIIIYEDSASMTAKMNMAKAYGVRGLSLWSLGNIPDYNDTNGMKFKLNIWQTITQGIKNLKLPAVASKAVKFTDSAVEASIRNKTGKLAGVVYESDLEGIFRLKVSGSVKNINDLKYLKNLEYLELQSTGVSNITPLASLTNLRVLYLQRNSVSDISPIGKLTKLQVLSLNGNKVSNIEALGKLTALERLYLKENGIKNVNPLGKLVNLKALYLEGNGIADFSPLSGLKTKLLEKDFEIK